MQVYNNYLKIIFVVVLAHLFIGADAKTYLVSVGISDYSTFPHKLNSLTLPTKDAQTIAWLYSKNTQVDYCLLLDAKATKNRIKKAMSKVFNQAGVNDIVVFFFSGHGYAGGFCAADGNLSYDEVRKVMAQSRCKNKMMFVDACRSGGMRVNRQMSGSSINAAKNANIMLFLSSRTTENSIENPRMKNGFFTTYLQKGLRGNADKNRDKVITAKELFDFVHGGVTRMSENKQHPVMWGKFSNNMPVMVW